MKSNKNLLSHSQKSAELLRLFETNLALIFDTSGVICDVSPSLCKDLECLPSDLIRQTHPLWDSDDMMSALNRIQVWIGERNLVREGKDDKWLHCTVIPILDEEGEIASFLELIVDITEQKLRQLASEALSREHTEELEIVTRMLEADVEERRRVEMLMREQQSLLLKRNKELQTLNQKFEQMQGQLLQSEKLASIGQLAAGVAHEINNPIGYVSSNLSTMSNYLSDIFQVIEQYEALESYLPEALRNGALAEAKQAADMEFLKDDMISLLVESREGISRVKKIVQDLKDFSRVDSTVEWEMANIHRCLDSTLNIVHNEIKYKAEVFKEYGELPNVECLPSQLNQVFMNMLVNAGHAIQDTGKVWIRTGMEKKRVWIEFQDTGCGIAPENLKRVFDPFFTTKAVGKGTGLGLSLSYGIVQKHGGEIQLFSKVGEGTRFRIWLPIMQPKKLQSSNTASQQPNLQGGVAAAS